MMYKFTFRGLKMLAIAMPFEEYAKVDTGSVGQFFTPEGAVTVNKKYLGIPLLVFDAERMTIELVRHEVWHMAMWSSMTGTTTSLTTEDSEEIGAEIFAYFSRDLIKLSDTLYKELTKTKEKK